MSKGGGSQTVSTRLDPKTQDFVDQMRRMAIQGAGTINTSVAGPTGAFTQGLEGLQNLPQYAQQFFNPFQDQVIGGVQADFDRQRQFALNNAAQQATGAGAFGGSRSGILQAQALGDVNQNEAQTLANLRMGGYNNALNFGMQNAQQLMQGGEALRQIQNQQSQTPFMNAQQRLQLMNLGLGPFGTSQSQPMYGNPLGGAAGGALAGSAFGPIGTAIGGGIGLLGGLFG